jgi:selenide,water dikinase
MLQSNQSAARMFQEHQASACTDITGFGLLGHLAEMIKGSAFGVELFVDELPVLAGVLEVIEAGILSSLQPQNARMRRLIVNQQDFNQHPKYPLLFDPQTSGGLLASVPKSHSDACLLSLRQAGHADARCIGRVSKTTQAGLVKLLTGDSITPHQR